jgi:hypothetical protein
MRTRNVITVKPYMQGGIFLMTANFFPAYGKGSDFARDGGIWVFDFARVENLKSSTGENSSINQTTSLLKGLQEPGRSQAIPESG